MTRLAAPKLSYPASWQQALPRHVEDLDMAGLSTANGCVDVYRRLRQLGSHDLLESDVLASVRAVADGIEITSVRLRVLSRSEPPEPHFGYACEDDLPGAVPEVGQELGARLFLPTDVDMWTSDRLSSCLSPRAPPWSGGSR